MLILLFDIEEDLDKNKNGENDDVINFSDNENSNEEIIISSVEEVNDNNLDNLINTFKTNIDEIIKSYAKHNYNLFFKENIP